MFYWIKKQNIPDKDYVFVNFEDDEMISLKREEKIKFLNYHVELYGKEPEYIFLDEIQNLERWDSFLYSLIEKKKYKIFVTGSSSKLLSKEMSTSLRGRTIDHIVFPLSFKEILNLKNIEIKELIQVTYGSSFDEINPREYRALIKASELFKEAKLTIITWDYEDQRTLEWWGRKALVRFVPLWKWLLKT